MVFVDNKPIPNCPPPLFLTIQGAVNAVPSGGTVFVCRGTYIENVVVPKSVKIDGEFRLVIVQAGSLAQPAFDITAGPTQVANLIIEKGGASRGAGVRVVGIPQITVGPGDLFRQNQSPTMGGGVFILDSPAIVFDNVFEDNTSGSLGGGGLACVGTQQMSPPPTAYFPRTPSTLTLRMSFNTFKRNNAFGGSGGAVLVSSREALPSPSPGGLNGGYSFRLDNNEFRENRAFRTSGTDLTKADGSGGAIYLQGARTMGHFLEKNMIEENTAQHNGGGVAMVGLTEVEFRGPNIIIKKNTAGRNGGGIHSDALANTTIRRDTLLADNTASQGGGGASVECGAILTGVQNTISGNKSLGAGAFMGGGGILVANGRLRLAGGTALVLVSKNNASAFGGGIAALAHPGLGAADAACAGVPTVLSIHCTTLADNNSIGFPIGGGGGVYAEAASGLATPDGELILRVDKTDVISNSALSGADGIQMVACGNGDIPIGSGHAAFGGIEAYLMNAGFARQAAESYYSFLLGSGETPHGLATDTFIDVLVLTNGALGIRVEDQNKSLTLQRTITVTFEKCRVDTHTVFGLSLLNSSARITKSALVNNARNLKFLVPLTARIVDYALEVEDSLFLDPGAGGGTGPFYQVDVGGTRSVASTMPVLGLGDLLEFTRCVFVVSTGAPLASGILVSSAGTGARHSGVLLRQCNFSGTHSIAVHAYPSDSAATNWL
ncbi:MAG: right-handed parallel beta-helix repeat-containing protein [Planctomycetales bacterium]|nr:right-handed parallel beta-helix repeat-containing protein [Planctomycetales bacterium]